MQCAGGNDQIERSNGSGAVRVTDEGAGRPGVQFNPHLEYREADGNILEPTVKICALYACCRFDPGFFFWFFFCWWLYTPPALTTICHFVYGSLGEHLSLDKDLHLFGIGSYFRR